MPTLGERTGSLAKAAKAAVVATANGELSLAARRERLAICGKCEFSDGSMCTKCGCYLRLKTILSAWHCPIGKW